MKKTRTQSNASNDDGAGDGDIEDELGSNDSETTPLPASQRVKEQRSGRHRSRSRTKSRSPNRHPVQKIPHEAETIFHSLAVSPKYLEPQESSLTHAVTVHSITNTLFKWLVIPFIQGMFYACGEGLSRHLMAKYCGIPWYRPKIFVEHSVDSFIPIDPPKKRQNKT